jgi:glutathione peroxidase
MSPFRLTPSRSTPIAHAIVTPDIPLVAIDGRATTLAEYAGKVLLVVNTASNCGFTPQYAELEQLWRRYKERGLVVLGFPCNQFGGQEPAAEGEIARFCSLTYDVTFPMFAKVEVNGDGAHPLFQFLKSAKPGVLGTEGVKWNFTKWLIGRDGAVLERFGPNTKPAEIAPVIERALG